MGKWILVSLAAVLLGLYSLGPIIRARLAPAPEPASPTYVVIERKGISDGYDIDLSIQSQDIRPADLEALARQERRNRVRMLVYRPEQMIGTEKPAALWEFTTAKGLKQIY